MPIPAGMSEVLQMQGLSWGDPGQGQQAAAYFVNGGFTADNLYDRGGVVFHVEAFRQRGDTDDQAIQRTVNTAIQNISPSSNAGCIVQLAPRVYQLQNAITVPTGTTGLWIRGTGMYSTVMQPLGAFAAISCPTGTVTALTISDLFCYGGTNALSFQATTVNRTRIFNVLFEVTHTAAIDLTGGNILSTHIANCMFLSTNDDCILTTASNVVNNLFIEQCWFQTDRGATYLHFPSTSGNNTNILVLRCTFEGPAQASLTAPVYIGDVVNFTMQQCHFADWSVQSLGLPLIKTLSATNGSPLRMSLIANDFVNSDGPVIFVGNNNTTVSGDTWEIVGGEFTSKSGTAPITLESAGRSPRTLAFKSVYFGYAYDWSTFGANGVLLENCYDANQLIRPFYYYPASSKSVIIDSSGNLLTNGTQLGFYGASAVSQQNGTGNTHTVAAGATTNVFTNTTFDGSTGSTAYTVGDIVKALKAYGLLAS